MFFCFGLVLSPDIYGMVAMLMALGAFLVQATDLGMSYLLVQESARESGLHHAMGGIVLLRLLLIVPMLGAYVLSAHLVGGTMSTWTGVVFGVYLLGTQVTQDIFSFLRGARRTNTEGMVGSAFHVLEIATVGGWYLWTRHDVVLLMEGLALLRFAFLLLLLGLLVRWYRVRPTLRPAIVFLRSKRGSVVVLGLLGFALLAHSQIDVFLLRWFHGAAEVGRYWACYRVLMILHMPTLILINAVFPRVAAALGDQDRMRQICDGQHRLGTIWSLSVTAGCLLHAQAAVQVLLGPQFQDVTPLFSLLAVALGVANLPPFGLLLAMEPRPTSLLTSGLVAVAFNTCLNLLLIPRLGPRGAAWATLGSYLLLKVCFILLLRARQLPPFHLRSLFVTALSLGLWWGVSTWARLHTVISLSLLGLVMALLLGLNYRGAHAQIERCADDRAS